MTPTVISKGVVLGKRATGEANTVAFILTEKFGLLRASARSARQEKSKLRYGLEPFVMARFSFVRGKHEWKITGVMGHEQLAARAASPVRLAMGRIARLLMRLVQGEEASPELFSVVEDGLRALAGEAAHKNRLGAELIVVLRILHALGYVPKAPEFAAFLADAPITLELTKQAEDAKPLLLRTINSSLSATGL